MSDFFAAKTLVVEAELRFVRKEKGDWAKALDLISRVVKEEDAHWYFRGRALLTKAEIFVLRDPEDYSTAFKTLDFALKELRSRPDDYFTNKGKLLKAELDFREGNWKEPYAALLEAAKLTRDPRLARRVYAGADMLLVPSRYEPCGLAQMIGMRDNRAYGLRSGESEKNHHRPA